MERNETLKNMSIKRCAELIYYNLYGETRHPRYNDYDDIDEFIRKELPENESGDITDIDELFDVLSEKLEEQNHSKSVIFRSILNFIASPHFDDRHGLPDEINEWIEDSIQRLMHNENDILAMFPIHIWYKVDGQYTVKYTPPIYNWNFRNQLRGRSYQRRANEHHHYYY